MNGPGLYFHGAAGLVARAFQFHIRRTPGLERQLHYFQRIRDIKAQAAFYRAVATGEAGRGLNDWATYFIPDFPDEEPESA